MLYSKRNDPHSITTRDTHTQADRYARVYALLAHSCTHAHRFCFNATVHAHLKFA